MNCIRVMRAGFVVVLVSILVSACGTVKSPWPNTSRQPVRPLDHPTLEESVAGLRPPAEDGFQFGVFGDQRALADGEWQRLVDVMAKVTAGDDRFLFVLDTGDIVEDGSHTDQFTTLREILSPLADRPYLVGVGNHEVHNNRPGPARENTATFLSYLDPALSSERLYYRKDIGSVRFLFLETNDFVYGPKGEHAGSCCSPELEGRVAAQLDWLAAQLAEDWTGTQIAVLHHPLVQSSRRHRGAALKLWDLEGQDGRLVDLLLDGGVDLVLVGHTHTYERFSITREADGRSLQLVNISGRPRSYFLWFGAGARRARDITGRELDWLSEAGWNGLDGYAIQQKDAMTGEESNQFAMFTVETGGGLLMELFWLDEADERGYRTSPPVRLK